MSKIENVFTTGRKALIAYITAGYPDIETTLRVVPLLIESGCDIIELGIPFSDPLADGVTIQNASYKALQNGVDVAKCLEVSGRLNTMNSAGTPLVFMTYYNPVLNYGLEKFCRECSDSGICGLIIPDLPPEEGQELQTCTSRHGLDIIYLLAPNSPDDRIKLVAERSHGFIYLVSLTGVTGVRDQQTAGLEEFVARVRSKATQALCVGFGIATPEHAACVVKFTDGVIIGSRIIQLIESDTSLNSVREFIRDVRKAIG